MTDRAEQTDQCYYTYQSAPASGLSLSDDRRIKEDESPWRISAAERFLSWVIQ
jgi:hypothetical protein